MGRALIAWSSGKDGAWTLHRLLARDFGRGRITAAVNNLFDEQYYTYAVRSQFTADRYAVYPLPGRTFSATLELKLD